MTSIINDIEGKLLRAKQRKMERLLERNQDQIAEQKSKTNQTKLTYF